MDKLYLCPDESSKLILLEDLVNRGETRILSFVNAHGANLVWEDVDFRENLLASDWILRDGSGMQMLLRLLLRAPGLNLNGTDFIPELLRHLPRGACLAVYGTKEPYLSAGVKILKSWGIEIADSANGFYEDSYYVDRLKEIRPDFVLLAMGMPKQERVAVLLKQKACDHPVLIINGGAVVDFLAGRFERAPLWMRRIGMEWAFRLCKEPARLWRRYVVGNSLFSIRAFSYWCAIHKLTRNQ
ncbi:MAG: hypothetical protein BA869_06100 [Desulfuromonadales bacterium C00003107]|jgi:exopolysaccharide biosynthesis WecB/TagA/CpsF family protein|nr:MAG: hypothetical protein BA869_06100 [Desulfuromonadales bacterium C00003107]